MRIGIIAHLKHPISEPFAGGLEMHTHLLASRLKNRGHDVVVFASTHSDDSMGLQAICSQTTLDAFGNAEDENSEFFREHHAYLSLMNELRSSTFDIIHNNSLHYLPIVLADALPVPVVTSLHTPPFALLESGVRIASGNRPRFIAVSNAISRQWSSVVDVHTTISNGVDLSNFAFREMPDDDPYLVWYGRIVPEKGLHLALDAARLIGMTLKFAGPIADQDYFDQEVAHRLNDRTIYVGHLTHVELAKVIGGARAFLCTPCWEEPFGLVVAESLACGVPVAAFARGAIPEILDLHCGALARPDDVESLANAAVRAQKLQRKDCRHRAETVCDAEVMVDGYEATYAAALADHVRIARRTEH